MIAVPGKVEQRCQWERKRTVTMHRPPRHWIFNVFLCFGIIYLRLGWVFNAAFTSPNYSQSHFTLVIGRCMRWCVKDCTAVNAPSVRTLSRLHLSSAADRCIRDIWCTRLVVFVAKLSQRLTLLKVSFPLILLKYWWFISLLASVMLFILCSPLHTPFNSGTELYFHIPLPRRSFYLFCNSLPRLNS